MTVFCRSKQIDVFNKQMKLYQPVINGEYAVHKHYRYIVINHPCATHAYIDTYMYRIMDRCACTHTYTHAYIHIYILYSHIHACLYLYIYIFTCKYVCIYLCLSGYTHTYICIHMDLLHTHMYNNHSCLSACIQTYLHAYNPYVLNSW